MPTTLKLARQNISRKLGGHLSGLVSLAPDAGDALAQRSILSSKLYDADKGNKGYAGQFAWVGKYRNERRVRENGYRSLPYVVYTPPISGTYTITVYGFGTTLPIAYNATNTAIQSSIQAIGNGIASVTVTGGAGSPTIIQLPDISDVEISAGSVLSTGSIGSVEVNRSFTKALQVGDEWELHTKLPVEDSDEVQGLNWCVNFAARKLFMVDQFPITPVRNTLGTKTFLGLTGESWLTDKKQIIAMYSPTEWGIQATFTPPTTGVFTLTVDIGSQTYTTAPIAYNATGQAIQDALTAAATGLSLTVSPLTLAGTYTLALVRTWYAQASITASAGTVVQSIFRLRSPSLYPNVWNFQYDAENPYIDNVAGTEGKSLLVEAYRQAHSWVCPQQSYGVLGTTWQSSDVGMVDDYDQINVTLDDIVAVGYAYACQQLSMVGLLSERGEWASKAKEAFRVAAGIKFFDMPLQEKPMGGRGGASVEAKGFFN